MDFPEVALGNASAGHDDYPASGSPVQFRDQIDPFQYGLVLSRCEYPVNSQFNERFQRRVQVRDTDTGAQLQKTIGEIDEYLGLKMNVTETRRLENLTAFAQRQE